MHDEGNADRVEEGRVSIAIVGGLLISASLLSAVFLGSALLLPASPLGAIGIVLFAAFSWVAWAIPLLFLGLALLALGPRFEPRRAVALAAASIPFLAFAAFARTLDLRFPLLPGLNSAQTRLAALAFAVSGVGLSALITWLGTRQTPLAGSAGDSLVEEGRRPGLEAEFEEDDLTEDETPTAGGRRIEEVVEAHEAGSGKEEPEETLFRLPEIPPLPRLRSLGETESGAFEHEDFEFLLPEEEDLTPEKGDPTPEEAGASEVPIPLFFREEERDSPRGESLGSAAISTPSISLSPQLREGGGRGQEVEVVEATRIGAGSAPSPLRAIEVISVPPRPAAEEAGPDAGRAAIIERILARKKKIPYAVPVGDLLLKYPDGEYWIVDDKTRHSAEVLRETLGEFGIEAEVTGIRKGPVITMFEILPAPGVRLSKIANLADNIALRLAASSVRIVAPIPGKHAVGIEVPNEKRSIVSLREIVESEVFAGAKAEVPVALGKDIAGEVQFIDLTQTPHLLIAGSTGSGKSVCVNSIILSILFRRSPEECRLLLIDPKIVELKLYNDVPHLLTPVITEPKRAFQALQYCICEMERRYAMLDRLGVRDIRSYNRKVREKGLSQEKLPYIVVIVDEFADLMATTGKELESTLARLAAMSRAVGIHLVLATQRPSIDVITGLIKANIPSRVAFMVASKFDSRIIIDMVGAEKLLGKGDMLFASAWDPFPIRMQGAFVSEEEVEKAVEFVKTLGEPEYIDDDIFIDDEEDEAEPNLFDDGDGDPLFEQALEIVLQQGKASASYIQRKLKIGYNRAARLVELMEEKGIVGKAQGSKPRDLVRNPSIVGLASSASDSAGVSRSALKAMEEGDAVDAGGPLTMAGAADAPRGQRETESVIRSGGLPPLVGKLETVPGQRVTGRDEE